MNIVLFKFFNIPLKWAEQVLPFSFYRSSLKMLSDLCIITKLVNLSRTQSQISGRGIFVLFYYKSVAFPA